MSESESARAASAIGGASLGTGNIEMPISSKINVPASEKVTKNGNGQRARTGSVSGIHFDRPGPVLNTHTSSAESNGVGPDGAPLSLSMSAKVRATIEQQRVAALLANLVHKPTPRFEWDEDHTKVFRMGGHLEESWCPEFLDLILVAALLKLGDSLHFCEMSGEEIFFCAMEFMTIFQTRFMIDEFMWHFFLDDLWNQSLFFLYIIGVFILALMVSYTVDDNGHCAVQDFHLIGYFIGLIITRTVLSIFWIVELYFDDAARGEYYMHPTRNFITIVLSLVGLILVSDTDVKSFHREDAYYLIAGVMVNEYYLQFYKSLHLVPLIQLNEFWPLNLLGMTSKDHMTEVLFECDEELETVQSRMGIFILIVLGESVIQLLLPSFDVKNKEMREGTLYITLLGVLLVWSIAKQFFDAAQRVPSGHALRRCMQSGSQWMAMHAVAGLFVFAVGVGLKLLYEDFRNDVQANFSHRVVMAAGCSGSVVCFCYMRYLHKGFMEWPANKARLSVYLLRFCIGFLHLSVIWWDDAVHGHDPATVIGIHVIIAVGLNSLDLYNFQPAHHVNYGKNLEGLVGSEAGTGSGAGGDSTTHSIASGSPRGSLGVNSPDGNKEYTDFSGELSDEIFIPVQPEVRHSSSNIFAAFTDPFSGRKERAEAKKQASSTNLLEGTSYGRIGSRPGSKTGSRSNSSSNLMVDANGLLIKTSRDNSCSNLIVDVNGLVVNPGARTNSFGDMITLQNLGAGDPTEYAARSILERNVSIMSDASDSAEDQRKEKGKDEQEHKQ